eukprot:scaffold228510_cov17-Tisochrysis_lutea.AAC.1
MLLLWLQWVNEAPPECPTVTCNKQTCVAQHDFNFWEPSFHHYKIGCGDMCYHQSPALHRKLSNAACTSSIYSARKRKEQSFKTSLQQSTCL